jgi:hypothetical protein
LGVEVGRNAVKLSNLLQFDAHLSMTRSIDDEIKRVTVTLPRRQLDALQAIAMREDVSVAWLVRKAVEKMLRDGPALPITNHSGQAGKRR